MSASRLKILVSCAMLLCVFHAGAQAHDSINDKDVCTRLREFVKGKLENDEITIERATDALISFASDRWQEKYWSDFYMVSIFDEYQSAGFADQVETFAMIREFINTGKRLDANKFWLDREKKSKENYRFYK